MDTSRPMVASWYNTYPRNFIGQFGIFVVDQHRELVNLEVSQQVPTEHEAQASNNPHDQRVVREDGGLSASET